MQIVKVKGDMILKDYTKKIHKVFEFLPFKVPSQKNHWLILASTTEHTKCTGFEKFGFVIFRAHTTKPSKPVCDGLCIE